MATLSDAELSRLKQMLDEGRQYREISQALKQPFNLLVNTARKNGWKVNKEARSAQRITTKGTIAKRKPSGILPSYMVEIGVTEADLRAMVAECLTNSMIADRIGSTEPRVQKALLALDIRRTKEQKSKSREHAFAAFRALGIKNNKRDGHDPHGPTCGDNWTKASAELRDRILALYARENRMASRAAA